MVRVVISTRVCCGMKRRGRGIRDYRRGRGEVASLRQDSGAKPLWQNSGTILWGTILWGTILWAPYFGRKGKGRLFGLCSKVT
jgi:hypothetical protein